MAGHGKSQFLRHIIKCLPGQAGRSPSTHVLTRLTGCSHPEPILKRPFPPNYTRYGIGSSIMLRNRLHRRRLPSFGWCRGSLATPASSLGAFNSRFGCLLPLDFFDSPPYPSNCQSPHPCRVNALVCAAMAPQPQRCSRGWAGPDRLSRVFPPG